MKKIKYAIFVGTIVIPSLIVSGAEQSHDQTITVLEEGNEITETTVSEEIKKSSQEQLNGQEMQQEEVIQEEVIQEETDQVVVQTYLTYGKVKECLETDTVSITYMNGQNLAAEGQVSYGTMAKIICEYIERAPISLPAQEGVQSGYIGRLVLEGIWQDITLESNMVVSLEDWNTIYTRAKSFVANPDSYEKTFLDSLEKSKKERFSQYKQTEKALGTLHNLYLGEAEKSTSKLTYNGQSCDLYTYSGKEYITIQSLEYLGFEVQRGVDAVVINKGVYKENAALPQSYTKEKVKFNTKDVYMGNLRTYSLSISGGTLIPVEALKVLGELAVTQTGFEFNLQNNDSQQYIKMNKQSITNVGDTVLDIQLTNYYWDGSNIIEEKWGINKLAPGVTYASNNKVYALNKNKIYLTTVINQLTSAGEVLWYTGDNYGQANKELLKHYEEQIKKQEAEKQKEVLSDLFPSSIIIGTMKTNAGPFKKGEKVEVYRADDGKYYYLHHKDEIVRVPWSSVSIPANPKVETKQATVEQLEAYINSIGLTSPTKFLVWTDLYRQRTYVFERHEGKWRIFKDKITKNDKVPRNAILECSTGKNITPTPRGIFNLQAYVPYFGVNKGYRCKTAVQISGDYLYHSLIFNKEGTRLLEGKGVLGQRASQGCIRFGVEESEWFYNTMPLKTIVWIN